MKSTHQVVIAQWLAWRLATGEVVRRQLKELLIQISIVTWYIQSMGSA